MNSPYIIDAPDLPYRHEVDTDSERLDDLTFSPEEDAKLERAANRGKVLQAAVLAGGEAVAVALQELRKIGIVRWEHRRAA